MTLQHAPLLFEVHQGELHVGGEPVTALADRLGTPFYAYDARLIRTRIHGLRQLLPAKVEVHFAIKANPFLPLLELMSTLVEGADVASARELEWAMRAGFHPHGISFAGPGKRDEELGQALKAGVTVHVESPNELKRLLAHGERLSIRPRLALRINPPFELKGAGMRMGGGAKPFGIDAELAPKILKEIKRLDVEFAGLHIFSGSQCLHLQALFQAQQETLNLARQLLENADITASNINIGGGWGIPYFPGEQRLDPAQLAAHLHKLLQEHQAWLGETKIILELGRFLVGEAGVYVTRVLERKHSRGETFLITDGGMHHHLALSGNLGQVIRKNYPVYHATRMDSPAEEIVHIHGPLCTPLDVLGHHIALPHAKIGDLLAVTQSGAYGLSASPINFLSHPCPAEILVG